MKDYAIRGIALDNSVRVLGVQTTQSFAQLAKMLTTTPCASAALGRTTAITILMGLMQKNDDIVTVTIDGNGSLGKIHAQYLGDGKYRGYVDHPHVDVLINDQKKLDVKGVVGSEGTLNVVLNQGLKTDYHGTSPLISGEISEDFTYYFATSEQTPSVVSSGVLVNEDNEVISSGALIIQLMPEASEEVIKMLEDKMSQFSNLSGQLLDSDIKKIITSIFDDFEELAKQDVIFDCTCSHEEMYWKIASLSIADLEEIKQEDKQLEAVCPWCNSKYLYSEDELAEIIELKKKEQDKQNK